MTALIILEITRRPLFSVTHLVRGGGGGGEIIPEKLGGGVWPTSQNAYLMYDQNL